MPHTPGPWCVIPTLDGFEVRHRSCVEYYLKGTATERAAELNAAELVRDAAPQLLAACEAAKNVITYWDLTKTEDIVATLEQVVAAIQLARGA